jgi:hypothetical protein
MQEQRSTSFTGEEGYRGVQGKDVGGKQAENIIERRL